jgi:hypothetical protein
MRGLGREAIVVRWVANRSWKTLRTYGVCRSECRLWLAMYHGAFVEIKYFGLAPKWPPTWLHEENNRTVFETKENIRKTPCQAVAYWPCCMALYALSCSSLESPLQNWNVFKVTDFYQILDWLKFSWFTKIRIIYSSKVKIKQFRYRSWQVHRVPAGWGSQISRQSAQEGGKVVSPTHRQSIEYCGWACCVWSL